MRTLLFACALSLFLGGGAAFAQSVQRSEPATQKSDEDIKAIKERVAWWLKTCLGDWDRATHMTKREWRITCERVATERGKFLVENSAMDAFVKGRQR
jgi:hypothetical protein